MKGTMKGTQLFPVDEKAKMAARELHRVFMESQMFLGHCFISFQNPENVGRFQMRKVETSSWSRTGLFLNKERKKTKRKQIKIDQ